MSIIKVVLSYYNRIPTEIRNILSPFYNLLPQSIKYGKTYRKEKKQLEYIKSLNKKELENYTNELLQKLICYAYKHVPYYHKLFDDNNINPESIKTKEDLIRIPFLTKEIVKNNIDQLISDEYKKKDLVCIATSGTTGTPMRFYVQYDSHMRDWVYVEKMFKKYGFSFNEKKLVLRGKLFGSKKIEYDAFRKDLSINVFNMSEESIDEYFDKIEKYKPSFIYGFPSSIYVFAKYIKKSNRKLNNRFKCCITISESIYDYQKKFIENVFDCDVVTFYGMSERVIIAGQDLNHSEIKYNIEEQYGIAELIDKENRIIQKSNIKGELVGTSLLNYGMPLIRYKTGDISSYYEYASSINAIEGRKLQDCFIDREGNVVSISAYNIHTTELEKIERQVYYQDKIGEVTILAKPLEELSKEDIHKILNIYNRRSNNSISFDLKIVDHIDLNKNGKSKIVDQRLSLKQFINK